MIDTVPPPDASLPEFLAARARHSSDARLAVIAVAGFAGLILSAVWAGTAWLVFASASACMLGFGAWGIADRELGERGGASPGARRALRAIRAAAAAVGTAGGILFLGSALAVALGTIIS